MKVFVRDQQRRLADFLSEYRRSGLSYAATTGFRDRVTRLPVPWLIPGPALDRCNFEFLFNYQIFPARILVFAADWQASARPMQSGDTIVQQAFLPPLPLSLKCVFGVRIVDTFRTSSRVGFRYGTLAGHAETGESEFYFERSGEQLEAVIHTRSQPGLFLSRLAGPFFTYPYQQYCANQALRQMQSGFLAANPSGKLAVP